MTATAAGHNHQIKIKIPDENIPAARSWKQKEMKAFGDSGKSGSGTQQAEFLPLGRPSDILEQNQVNVPLYMLCASLSSFLQSVKIQHGVDKVRLAYL